MSRESRTRSFPHNWMLTSFLSPALSVEEPHPRLLCKAAHLSLRHSFACGVGTACKTSQLEPPIIGRIADDTVLLDLRTVPPDFDDELWLLI